MVDERTHDAGHDSEAELTSEERWLRSWAFATSPHGLGLEPERYWEMTPRELYALRMEHRAVLLRWAVERAMYANVNYRQTDSSGRFVDEPWIAEDFLGETSRQKRNEGRFGGQEALLRKIASGEMDRELREKVIVEAPTKGATLPSVEQLNVELAKIVKGAPPPKDLPPWARG